MQHFLSSLPCNLDVEEAVLGACLFDPEAFQRIKDILTPESFFVPAHQEIFRAIAALDSDGKSADLITLTGYFKDSKLLESVGGTDKLVQLGDRCMGLVNLDRYAKLLLDKQTRRMIIQSSYQIALLAHQLDQPLDKIIEQVESEILDCTHSRGRFSSLEEYQRSRYQRLIAKVRTIELGISDPGERAYRLRELAKQVGSSSKELEQLYYKSLLAEENEDFFDLAEAYNRFEQDGEGWLVNGLIPKGSTILLHAPGGVGKTLFTTFLADLLTKGETWDLFTPTKVKRKVALIQTDEPFNAMIKKLAHREISPDQPLLVKTRWAIDHIEPLRQEIISKGIEFVIIDSLTSISRHSLYSENDIEYARPLLHLRDLAQETGCTFLIIHHDNKQGEPRGTGAIFNSVSEVWSLKKHPQAQSQDDPRRLLAIEKSRSRRPVIFLCESNFEDYSWEIKQEMAVDQEQGTIKESVVRFLADESPKRYQRIELEEILNCSGGYLRRCLNRLAEDGIIQRERSKSQKAYSYFVICEKLNVRESSSDPLRGGVDHLDDHLYNPGLEPVTSVSDPTTAEDHIIAKFEAEGKRQGGQDHLPVGNGSSPDGAKDAAGNYPSDRPKSENRSNPDGTGSVPGESLSDPSDPLTQLSLPKFSKGDRVIFVAEDPDYQGAHLEIVSQTTSKGVHLYQGQTGNGKITEWLFESDLIEERDRVG